MFRRIKLDKNAIIKYNRKMCKKYEERPDKDNIYPVGLNDTEFTQNIINIILGEDWCVVDPLSRNQINEIALEAILDKIDSRWNVCKKK